MKNKKTKVLKAQTMLVTMVLVILVIVGTLAFLISTIDVFKGDDYIKLHATSLVTSLLRTDSGYGGDVEKCKTVGDILHCAATTSSWLCGSARCGEIADSLVDVYIQKALDPKLDYSFRYGGKATALSKDLSNRTGAYKINQQLSKSSQDIDIVFIVAQK